MSPVYERRFPEWDGTRTPAWRRVAAIAREGLSHAVRSKWVWVLWTATLIHVGIRAAILYVTGTVDVPDSLSAGSLQFTEGFLLDAMAFQARWVLMIALALVAAGSLSRDLEAGALSFYFSKPITRTGYVVGKLVPGFAVGLTVTALPGLLLWLVGVAFTPEAAYPAVWVSLPWRLLAAGALASLVGTVTVVALSGLLASRNVAAGAWVAISILTAGAAGVLAGLTTEFDVGLVDYWGSVNLTQGWLLSATTSAHPTAEAALVTLGWGLAGLAGIAYVLHEQEVGG